MNLAEDYFSKKYFPNEISPENFENRKSDCQILFFDQVFRRHHSLNDPINGIDPKGLWTIQLGGSLTGSFGFGSIAISGGIAFDGHGNVGTYVTGGAGVSAGVSNGAGGQIAYSNADSISDLNGAFNNTSIHGGAGLGGAIDIFSGTSQLGAPVDGFGFTAGEQAGASISSGMTYTAITPFGMGPATSKSGGTCN